LACSLLSVSSEYVFPLVALSCLIENWAKLNKIPYIMSLSEKSIKWTLNVELFKKSLSKYFCVFIDGKALCLIFSESIAVLKEYKIARHYSVKL
jgi:hypothetical protein